MTSKESEILSSCPKLNVVHIKKIIAETQSLIHIEQRYGEYDNIDHFLSFFLHIHEILDVTNSIIKRLIVLGGLSIAGILFAQSYILLRTWNGKIQEFNQTVSIALRNVAEKIAAENNSPLNSQNLIKRRSSNVYAVNVNSAIDANQLEEFLEQEFIKSSLYINFEYAVYDCATDELMYGNYCLLDHRESDKDQQITDNLPRFENLTYYFVVKFPMREGYLLTSMRQTIIFSLIALLAVFFFIYSIYVILKQKQLTELQKDFINNMTHEFKTPISSIRLASDVLIKSQIVSEDARLGRYAKIISEQNARLNTLVENVLDIAKIEGHTFRLNLEDLNLSDLLYKIIEGERLQFEQAGGSLTFNNSMPSTVTMQADALHFANILTNLLDNARKYCKKEPHAIVTLKNIKNNIHISISDNGMGIEKEHLKKLFNKFYRVPTGNVHNVKGFGLGLFYVKNMCEAHGWEINVDSTLGKASTFTLVIPRDKRSV